MRKVIVAAAAIVLVAVFAATARAHFIFIRIVPADEGPASAEVVFGENAVDGDPQFLDRITHTELWAVAGDGEPVRIECEADFDCLRGTLPEGSPLVVAGRCQYGVVDRGDEPFLLHYYAKTVAGTAEEINALEPIVELPLEILPRCDGESVELTALRDGEPIPDAEFVLMDAETLDSTTLSADEDGRARWSVPGPGTYSFYLRHVTEREGTLDGESYNSVREYATLALAWPLETEDHSVGSSGGAAEASAARSPAGELFAAATEARAVWRDFPGFAAAVEVNTSGSVAEGRITVTAEGEVTVELDDPEAAAWLTDRMESVVLHRGVRRSRGDDSAGERPRRTFRFDDEDASFEHPLGRLIVAEGQRSPSTYRIRDREILMVNRDLGRTRFSITVLETATNEEGQYLPRSYVVHYWNAEGDLVRTVSSNDTWVRVGGYDLPERQIVITSSDLGLDTRSFVLSGHELLE